MSTWEIITYWYAGVSIALNIAFTIVVTVGGAFDLRYMFKKLEQEKKEKLGNAALKDLTNDDQL